MTPLVLAIDPGTDESGWVLWDGVRLLRCGVAPNPEMLRIVQGGAIPSSSCRLAIEMVASYGMAVGQEVFETCVWIGRFQEAWHRPEEVIKVYRQAVKLHLTGQTKAKDANVRKALLDLFPRTGGGATPQVGTKAKPGPLFGISSHAWPALGVAITALHGLTAPTPRRRRARFP